MNFPMFFLFKLINYLIISKVCTGSPERSGLAKTRSYTDNSVLLLLFNSIKNLAAQKCFKQKNFSFYIEISQPTSWQACEL